MAAKKAKKKGAGRNLSAAKTTAFRRTKIYFIFRILYNLNVDIKIKHCI